MSQQQEYQILCPKCGHQMEVALYDAINVGVDPDLRDILMENQLNAVNCEACQFLFRIDKPLLYNDPSRNLMIYWFPTSEEMHDKGELTFQETVTQMSSMIPDDLGMPKIHLVFSRTELVERIFLREAGLEERVIEYVKYMIYMKNVENVNPAEKALLFNAEDSTDETLVFVVQNIETRKLESIIEYSRQAYQGICEMFDQDEQTATLLEIFPGPYISARSLLLRELEVPDR
jgi:hypothetical protein